MALDYTLVGPIFRHVMILVKIKQHNWDCTWKSTSNLSPLLCFVVERVCFLCDIPLRQTCVLCGVRPEAEEIVEQRKPRIFSCKNPTISIEQTSIVILPAYGIYMIADCSSVAMADLNSVFQNTRCFYLDYISEFNV